MNKQHVYVLSTYGEHGAENAMATLTRERLPAMLSELMKTCFKNLNETEDQEGLKTLLEQIDEVLAGHGGDNLTLGWGGVQLHVLEVK